MGSYYTYCSTTSFFHLIFSGDLSKSVHRELTHSFEMLHGMPWYRWIFILLSFLFVTNNMAVGFAGEVVEYSRLDMEI